MEDKVCVRFDVRLGLAPLMAIAMFASGCSKASPPVPDAAVVEQASPPASEEPIATEPAAPALTPEQIEQAKLDEFCNRLRNWTDPETVFELAHPESQDVIKDPYQKKMLTDLYRGLLSEQGARGSQIVEIEDVWYPYRAGEFESSIRPTHMLVAIPPTAEVSPAFPSNAYWVFAKHEDEWKVIFPRHTDAHIAELERVASAKQAIEGKSSEDLSALASEIAKGLPEDLRTKVIEHVAKDQRVRALFAVKQSTGHGLEMVQLIVDSIISQSANRAEDGGE